MQKQILLVAVLVVALVGSVLASRLIAKPNPGDQLPFPVVEAS